MSPYLVPLFLALLAAYGLAAYGLGYHNHPRHKPAPLPRREPGSSLLFLPGNPDASWVAAGDRAALEVRARQRARDEKYRDRPRHAAWLTEDLTGEYRVVETTYEKEIAA